MIKERQLLEDALARNIISADQFQAMCALLEPTINRNPDERFRIVSGFSEVFISIGLLMLFGAVSGILDLIVHDRAVASCLTAGVAWLAATYFVDRRRYLLPSIFCCLYAAVAVGSAFWLMQGHTLHYMFGKIETLDLWEFLLPLGGCFTILVLAVWRFRIPFLMLPLGILFTGIILATASWAQYSWSYRLLTEACGLLILGIALRFDLRDPHRVHRASDFAFWCYIIASPLTIHPIFITLLLQFGHSIKTLSWPLALIIMLIACLFSVGALLINRRALVLSTLIYVGYCIGVLVSNFTTSAWVFLLPLFLIGLYVVVLGTAWRGLRKKLMERLAPQPWFSKLPPY